MCLHRKRRGGLRKKRCKSREDQDGSNNTDIRVGEYDGWDRAFKRIILMSCVKGVNTERKEVVGRECRSK